MPALRRAATWTSASAALAAAVVYGSGLGGYRGGTALAIGVMVGVPSVVFWWQSAGMANRGTWLATPVVGGLVVGAFLASLAPPSKGVLAERLDRLPDTNFTERSTRTAGHSWCSPSCPVLVRTYDGPDLAPPAAVFSMAVDLTTAGLIDQPPTGPTPEMLATGDDVDVIVTAERAETGEVVVTVELRARRG